MGRCVKILTMKIKLKDTKLVDENKRPITFFHVTPCEKIDRFFPLSHFGTQTAARMRSMHFVYKALGLPEPTVLPDQLSSELLQKYEQQKDAPRLSTYAVHLKMKSPIRISDLSHHSLEQYYRWFSNWYQPKSQYLTGEERCEGDVVGPERIKYKKVLTDFIFRDPFVQSEQDLKKELLSESFYPIPEKLEAPQQIPAFLFPVASRMDKRLYLLAEKVAFQRMIRYLEGEGYDGFVYQNEYEDKGQNSYIIFRPEQVFDLSEKTGEHLILEKTPKQKAFLRDVELQFFGTHKMLSPFQRIQNHLQQKLQKRRVRISKGYMKL